MGQTRCGQRMRSALSRLWGGEWDEGLHARRVPTGGGGEGGNHPVNVEQAWWQAGSFPPTTLYHHLQFPEKATTKPVLNTTTGFRLLLRGGQRRGATSAGPPGVRARALCTS